MKAPILALCLVVLFQHTSFAEDQAVVPLTFNKMSASPFTGRSDRSAGPFAHLVGLKIGSVALATDTTATHPLTAETISIVGAITSFQWSGRPADSMELTFVLTDANLKRMEAYLQQPAPPPEAEFNFQIYSVDAATNSAFIRLKSFHYPFRGLLNKVGSEMLSQKSESLPLRAVLSKTSGRLSLDLDADRRSARIQVLPGDPNPQNLILGSGPEQSRKIQWGR